MLNLTGMSVPIKNHEPNHCDGVGGEVSTQEQLYQNCWTEHDRATGSVAGAISSDCSCFWLDSSQKKTCRANNSRGGKCPYNPSVKLCPLWPYLRSSLAGITSHLLSPVFFYQYIFIIWVHWKCKCITQQNMYKTCMLKTMKPGWENWRHLNKFKNILCL